MAIPVPLPAMASLGVVMSVYYGWPLYRPWRHFMIYPPPYMYPYPPPYWPPYPPFRSPEEELAFLEDYRKMLEEEKKAIEQEISAVETRIRELRDLVEKSRGGFRPTG